MIKDMSGLRFGRLIAVEPYGKDKRGETVWLCKCDCGRETTVTGNKLRSGNTKSCGCLQAEVRSSGLHKTHGLSRTPLYTVWLNMKHRCYYPKNSMYKNYGGRGVSVCDEWLASFENFLVWAKKAGYKPGLSIDRIDVDGNYCPENCRWVTKKEQYLNRTDSHRITAFGMTKTIKEWSDMTGIKYDTIERRINAYKWSPEDAVSKGALTSG